MNVLILCTSFSPEPNGISIYSTDLANHLAIAGHKVKVITTAILDDQSHREFHHSDKIEVVRLGIRNTSSGKIFFAILNEIRLTLDFWKVTRRLNISSDTVIISFIPSLSTGIIARNISMRSSIPHLTIFQDFSSLGSRQVGSNFGKLLGPFLDLVERLILKQSQKIVVVSDEMVQAVEHLGSGLSEKVHLIHNYFIKKAETTETYDFRQLHKIDSSQFLVMHTGNIGRKQGIENVLNAAELLLDEHQILFIIIGGGNQSSKISKRAQSLRNVMMLPFQNEAYYSTILRSADVLLVSELPTQLGMSLPSKCIHYLESGVPIIASVPRNGPTARFLEGKALLVQAGNPSDLAKAILKVYANEIDFGELTRSGQKFVDDVLDARTSRLRYLNIIHSLQDSHK